MSFIIGNNFLFILLVGASVFVFCYMMSDRIIEFVYKRSMGTREEVIGIMDKMLMDVDKQRVTLIILLSSLGLGFLFMLLLWPNIIPGLIFGAAVTFAGWTAPKYVMNYLWEARCNRIVEQMLDGLVIMGNSIRAGQTVQQGMERVVENMRGPLPQEFNLILNKVRLGMSMEDGLNEFGDRIPRPDVQMFVTAVNILKETGGNLAETFSTIVNTIRERQKVEKRIQAMTAKGTMQAVIITLVPFVLMAIFLVISPDFVMPLFTRPLGWLALVIMLILQTIGLVMMKKIVTIKV